MGGIAGLALILMSIGFLYRMRRRGALGPNGPRPEPYLFDISDGERMVVLPRSTPSAVEKGVIRGQDIAVRLHDRELELATLQQERPRETSQRESRSATTESSSGGRNTDSNTEGISSRLDDLRDEITRLQGQQQTIINELRPPPGYNG